MGAFRRPLALAGVAILALTLLLGLAAPLLVGGDQMQIALGLPAAVAGVLQGAILFFVLGGSIFVNYRIRVIRPEKEPTLSPPEGPLQSPPKGPDSVPAGGSHD